MENITSSSEFNKEIEILRDFQRMLISILVCDKSQISDEINKLYDFFDNINISNKVPVYDGILHIIVQLSLNFGLGLKEERKCINQQTFYKILKQLISKYSLKEKFHQSTLFTIFQSNKHFLHFFFKEGIIDLSFIEKKIDALFLPYLFFFFIPEFRKLNPDFYKKNIKQLKITEKEIKLRYGWDFQNDKDGNNQQENDQINIQKENHSPCEIARIIRRDDIDSFLKFASNTESLYLNEIIRPSIFENNCDINQGSHRTTLLEYSMAFGAINIFRYLWMKKVDYSSESLQYCIIGGNFEIFHILEEESKYKFMDQHFYQAIKYYQYEISEYLFDSLEIKPNGLLNIFTSVNSLPNFELISQYFNNESIFTGKVITDNEMDFSSIFIKRIKDFPDWLCYVFFHFLFQDSKLNVNFTHWVFIVIQS
ncbi:hypothetical protein TRFO_03379 [Tritrichomonas foetus]|uniref:DUF3447 domain-containing protein n=1 Tax=Tritrichomonas foetus TaxID=1144522 RepID=A0A1J4KV82_9EUKA|nr:hypothetical protein TRFO_03379 [Tritrichomonas foetus]|eukprot:OHT13606.1 hypothetical protein TRFO_03379 [Tritrichomonas foetus]